MNIPEPLRILLGVPNQNERLYAKPERLTDVMALIQVLSLDEHTHRSEEHLQKEMQQDIPCSAESWAHLAKQHPEFFRVNPTAKYGISLVSRHVTKKTPGSDRRPPLDSDFVAGLLTAAIDIHDRQVRRNEKWIYLVPIWVALITGIFAFLTKVFS